MIDRRHPGPWLALLLLLAAMALAAGLLVLPVALLIDRQDTEIDTLALQLQRLQRTAALQPALASQINGQDRNGAIDDLLLPGESRAIAEAGLQARLGELVEQAGGRLESTQALPEAEPEILERITVRARFSGDTTTLRKVLYRIEFTSRGLIITALKIERAKPRRFNGRARPPAGPQPLRVTLEVTGYRRPEAAS